MALSDKEISALYLRAQDANEYLDLLAQCRSAFPIPERGDPLEVHWAAAMADPVEVPGYLQEIAARHAAQAAPAAVAGPVVNRATVIEWLDANDIEVTDRQMDGLFHFAAPTTQPVPQQEAQEPFAWHVCSVNSDGSLSLERAAEVAKLKGQRMVLCSLLGECLPVIDALLQTPGDDASDARLNWLTGRITGALNALVEGRVMGGES